MIFERLKERRKYEGYTQQEVANILNVQRATYAGWETGKDIMPLRQFFKLSNNYQLSLDYLTGLNDDESKVVSKTQFIDLNQVAERMKSFRKEKHLTQKQIADALQTTQSNIHKYETGKCLITTMYALEFSKHFDYPLDKLLGRK
ncbi:TPA: helix-turn-helix transcriptional regulator [Candidatus Ventrenecus avicola]|nr:helix-turn-helix transcriptional regulator [Candidatus Ventrenecus avicola]